MDVKYTGFNILEKLAAQMVKVEDKTECKHLGKLHREFLSFIFQSVIEHLKGNSGILEPGSYCLIFWCVNK